MLISRSTIFVAFLPSPFCLSHPFKYTNVHLNHDKIQSIFAIILIAHAYLHKKEEKKSSEIDNKCPILAEKMNNYVCYIETMSLKKC